MIAQDNINDSDHQLNAYFSDGSNKNKNDAIYCLKQIMTDSSDVKFTSFLPK